MPLELGRPREVSGYPRKGTVKNLKHGRLSVLSLMRPRQMKRFFVAINGIDILIKASAACVPHG
jgi:hypothetical protein